MAACSSSNAKGVAAIDGKVPAAVPQAPQRQVARLTWSPPGAASKRLALAQTASSTRNRNENHRRRRNRWTRWRLQGTDRDCRRAQSPARASPSRSSTQGGDYALAVKGNQDAPRRRRRSLDDRGAGRSPPSRSSRPTTACIETGTATVVIFIVVAEEDHHGLLAGAAVSKALTPPRNRPATPRSTRSTITANALRRPRRFDEVVCPHRSVHPRLHWRLDVVMNEDQDDALGRVLDISRAPRDMAINVMQSYGERFTRSNQVMQPGRS